MNWLLENLHLRTKPHGYIGQKDEVVNNLDTVILVDKISDLKCET